MPKPLLKAIALYGGADQAGARDLHNALAELRRLGGDDSAVLKLLLGDIAQDAARLRHEREAERSECAICKLAHETAR